MIDIEICQFLVRDAEAHQRRAMIAKHRNAQRVGSRELYRAREIHELIRDCCPGFSARSSHRSWRPS